MNDERGDEVGPTTEGRYWCFTWNNFDMDEAERVMGALGDHPDVTYVIAGQEEGAEGTPHLQGYIELRCKRRRRTVSAMLGGHTWLGRRYKKSSGEKCRLYCSKDGAVLWEWGELEQGGGQGSRTDLDGIKTMIDDGASLLDIAQENFTQFCYHRKAFAEYDNLLHPSPNWRDVECVLLWGKTRCGKSHYVRKFKELDCYPVASIKPVWFCGYNRNEAIVIEDYRGECDERLILNILDGYKMDVPFKGGFKAAHWKRVYITTNIHPLQLHNWKEESREAFKARFKAVIRFRDRMEPEDVDALVQAGHKDWGEAPLS